MVVPEMLSARIEHSIALGVCSLDGNCSSFHCRVVLVIACREVKSSHVDIVINAP